MKGAGFYKLNNDTFICKLIPAEYHKDTIKVALVNFDLAQEYLKLYEPPYFPDSKMECYVKHKKIYSQLKDNFQPVFWLQDSVSASYYKFLYQKNKKIVYRKTDYEWLDGGYVIDKNGKIFKPDDPDFKAGLRLCAKWVKIKE